MPCSRPQRFVVQAEEGTRWIALSTPYPTRREAEARAARYSSRAGWTFKLRIVRVSTSYEVVLPETTET